MAKRDREEEPEYVAAAHDLEAAAGRDADAARKTEALAAVRGLLDPTDERYEAQQGLTAAGALAALATLIGDANESVSADAAQTTEQLLRHSSVVTTRRVLAAGTFQMSELPQLVDRVGEGFLLGNPDQVSFNPIQAEAAETGIVSALVELYLEGGEEAQDAAWAALLAAEAFCRPNKLAALTELTRRLVDGVHTAKVLAAVDTLMDNMPFHDDVAVILDQALKPLLAVLETEDAGEVRAAARLLGTVLAKRPAVADFLVGEGALPTVAGLVATGDLETGDAAVTALWLLVRSNARLLRPDSDALGVAGTDLVKPLRSIILGSHSADADANNGEDKADDDADNGVDAQKLLHALAREDPEVADRVKSFEPAAAAEDAEPKPARCTIM